MRRTLKDCLTRPTKVERYSYLHARGFLIQILQRLPNKIKHVSAASAASRHANLPPQKTVFGGHDGSLHLDDTTATTVSTLRSPCVAPGVRCFHGLTRRQETPHDQSNGPSRGGADVFSGVGEAAGRSRAVDEVAEEGGHLCWRCYRGGGYGWIEKKARASRKNRGKKERLQNRGSCHGWPKQDDMKDESAQRVMRGLPHCSVRCTVNKFSNIDR